MGRIGPAGRLMAQPHSQSLVNPAAEAQIPTGAALRPQGQAEVEPWQCAHRPPRKVVETEGPPQGTPALDRMR